MIPRSFSGHANLMPSNVRPCARAFDLLLICFTWNIHNYGPEASFLFLATSEVGLFSGHFEPGLHLPAVRLGRGRCLLAAGVQFRLEVERRGSLSAIPLLRCHQDGMGSESTEHTRVEANVVVENSFWKELAGAFFRASGQYGSLSPALQIFAFRGWGCNVLGMSRKVEGFTMKLPEHRAGRNRDIL